MGVHPKRKVTGDSGLAAKRGLWKPERLQEIDRGAPGLRAAAANRGNAGLVKALPAEQARRFGEGP